MRIDKAIEILTDELHHIRFHLGEKGKAPEYYEELWQLARAMKMGIAALNDQQKANPAPICKTCGTFETCPWKNDPNIAEYRQTTEGRVVACSDYKRAL
jgi:hypothetical protein